MLCCDLLSFVIVSTSQFPSSTLCFLHSCLRSPFSIIHAQFPTSLSLPIFRHRLNLGPTSFTHRGRALLNFATGCGAPHAAQAQHRHAQAKRGTSACSMQKCRQRAQARHKCGTATNALLELEAWRASTNWLTNTNTSEKEK